MQESYEEHKTWSTKHPKTTNRPDQEREQVQGVVELRHGVDVGGIPPASLVESWWGVEDHGSCRLTARRFIIRLKEIKRKNNPSDILLWMGRG